MKAKRNFLAVIGMTSMCMFIGIGNEPSLAQTATGTAPLPAVAAQKVSSQPAAKDSIFKSDEDKVSYAIGVQMMGNFKRQGVEVNLDMLAKGMRDASSGGKLALEEGELRRLIMVYQNEVKRGYAQARKTDAVKNLVEAKKFLAENKKKPGVQTLASGVQYRVIKQGEGKKPMPTDTVECKYRGTLANGTEFDSSYRTGKPASFAVNSVIPGWQEVMKLMPTGSKWEVVIPPQHGYGQRGNGLTVGPNALLIFEIELLAIK